MVRLLLIFINIIAGLPKLVQQKSQGTLMRIGQLTELLVLSYLFFY